MLITSNSMLAMDYSKSQRSPISSLKLAAVHRDPSLFLSFWVNLWKRWCLYNRTCWHTNAVLRWKCDETIYMLLRATHNIQYATFNNFKKKSLQGPFHVSWCRDNTQLCCAGYESVRTYWLQDQRKWKGRKKTRFQFQNLPSTNSLHLHHRVTDHHSCR